MLAARSGLSVNGVIKAPVALAKICQRAEYQNTLFTDAAPSLLTGTRLWDLIGDRALGPSAHWLIQGFAHPEIPEVADVACFFPCRPSLVNIGTGLSGAAQMTLVGNSMHVAAVGSWTLHTLCSLDASGLVRQ